jgi:hypothetical protein
MNVKDQPREAALHPDPHLPQRVRPGAAGPAVLGGRITSTLLALLVIPTVYEILDDYRGWAASGAPESIVSFVSPWCILVGWLRRAPCPSVASVLRGEGVGRRAAPETQCGKPLPLPPAPV